MDLVEIKAIVDSLSDEDRKDVLIECISESKDALEIAITSLKKRALILTGQIEGLNIAMGLISSDPKEKPTQTKTLSEHSLPNPILGLIPLEDRDSGLVWLAHNYTPDRMLKAGEVGPVRLKKLEEALEKRGLLEEFRNDN